MKAIKYILSLVLLFTVTYSCVKDDFGTAAYVNTAVAPTEVTALFSITQDNSGMVTITPNSDGGATYQLNFGDASDVVSVQQGESAVHTYAEGNYDVKVTAIGVTGLKTDATIPLVVSFKAPENLVVEITNDPAITKQVNVIANADYASTFDVYFGEAGNDTPVSANIGETASYVYAEPGIYTIRVVAKGGAIQTTEYTVDFEATAIMQPINSAPTPPNRSGADVISIYGDAYTTIPGTNYNPDWGQSGQGSGYAEFDLNGDKMLQYINLSYQGIALADGTSIDVSGMEFLHMDVWTADVTQLETSLISLSNGEKPVVKDLTVNEWTSIEIPISDYTSQGLTVADIFQLKLVGTPWAGGTVFVDNIYFYKAPSVTSTILDGTWKLAPEAGALGVGPTAGDTSWWSNSLADVTTRACLFDDTYVFNSDGSFNNVLGADTWLEAWQGVAEGCGAPVAPHNGTVAATYSYDATAGTVTVNGVGAYLGIAKAYNGGELADPANAPASITYNATLSNNNNTMILQIDIAGGVWQFKLVRDGVVAPPPPIAGTWKLAPEADALGVGPAAGDISWWSNSVADVTTRACLFDDTYVFNADGSFNNVLGADTWLEAWQGVAEGCGAPVAPHNGTAAATYSYDATAGTVTVNGVGAYLGIAKAYNGGELADPTNAPASITYNATLSNNDNTMLLQIGVGNGFWQFKLVRDGSVTGSGGSTGGSGSTGSYDLTLPIDFESTGFGANWTWNVFENDTNPALEFVANPSTTGINSSSTVAKITALQTGQAWVGTETAHGQMGITWDLSASNAFIHIMVYKSVISDVGIKLATAAGGAQVEIKVPNTKINQWEELTFDFSSRIGNGLDGSTSIDQIIVFPDFDTAGRAQDNVVYFDNITFSSN